MKQARAPRRRTHDSERAAGGDRRQPSLGISRRTHLQCPALRQMASARCRCQGRPCRDDGLVRHAEHLIGGQVVASSLLLPAICRWQPATMLLNPLCSLDLRYEGDFHLVRPYGNESGTGWGRGDGTVTGERVSGRYSWSNHPRRRGDGSMLPNVRGVVTTIDGAELMLELTGRTSFDQHGIGHQSLFVL